MTAITAAHVMAARRELAKRSTADFATLIDIPNAPITEDALQDSFSTIPRQQGLAAHHQLLCDALDGIEQGRVANLMVLMPPGSAKSTYVDVVFIPRFMALKPRRNVILASYASEIAEKQGRKARQLAKSKAFANLMGTTLRADNSAVHQWTLDNGSEFMAGGLLSGLTGNRAALGIVDDPMKGRAEAESETIREKTWSAYTDDFCSRLIPGAPQIMILTRWHEDDLAGRILPEGWDGESGDFDGRDGRRWHVICLPAIADRADDPLGRAIGETLWPEWFSLEHWKPFQANPRTWSSLYQQKPSPEDGTYFQRAWFKHWSEKPKHMHYYGTSDYAVTEGGGDFTVHRIWGVDEHGDLYRVDGWRGQTTADVWIDRKLDLVAKYKPLAWFGESGVIQKSVEPMLKRRMHERRVYCRVEWLPSIADKPTRARGFQARIASGRVWFEPGADIDEHLKFPAGKHDDDVDNSSLMGRALDDAHPAVVPPREQKKFVDRWDEAFNRDQQEVDSWKTV